MARRPRVVEEEGRVVTVAGQPLRVSIRHGTVDSPPLLLMNGLGASLTTLNGFVAAVDRQRTVIRFDVPGSGESPAPLLPYRLWVLAATVRGMLDELGYQQVDVLGVSWGGLLAQQFAIQYPGRCRRVVLVSTVPGMAVPGNLSVLMEMASSRRHADADHMAAIGGRLYGGAVRTNLDHLAPLALGKPPDPIGYLYQQVAALGWFSLPWLPLLRQPTLILAGRDDPLVPLVNARLMQCMIPNASLHVFEDGHLGLMSQALTLAPLVEEFLDREQ